MKIVTVYRYVALTGTSGPLNEFYFKRPAETATQEDLLIHVIEVAL